VLRTLILVVDMSLVLHVQTALFSLTLSREKKGSGTVKSHTCLDMSQTNKYVASPLSNTTKSSFCQTIDDALLSEDFLGS